MDDTNLYEFLVECELQHYYHDIKNKLKIQKASQLKYATNEDLLQVGMTRPEIRRMHKFFEKKFPTKYLGKIKKFLTPQSSQSDNIYATHSFSSKISRRKVVTTDRSKSNEYVDTPPEAVAGQQNVYENEAIDSSDVNLIRKTAISGGIKLSESQVPSKHIIPADSIVINKELGCGEFGVVQQGAWTNNGERIQVAIKCLAKERMQSNTIEFLKEASIMHKIDHKHIVRLYGVVLDGKSLMLVTELAPLRSLLECLKEPALRSKFPLLTLCDFALQICDGMQYLESKRLIHRDLAARNILVFSRNLVKISDFGLSRALGQGKDYYQTNFNVNLKLPIAWCAPECISYLKFTSASDVWAYAVTLWEMFSYGFQPWPAMTGQQILEAIDEPNCQRLERPDCCPSDYYHTMLLCWSHDPNKRPKFADLFFSVLHDCRPEQVQATINYEPTSSSTKMLALKVGDIITVIDKTSNAPFWKGVLDSGKSGLFDPNNIVAYLGKDLPNSKSFSTTSLFRSSGRFLRNELKFASIGRRKLNRNMISLPKNDLKHTGHVGLDGAYFGDLGFLGGSSSQNDGVPKQIVAPYKPHEDVDFNTPKKTPKQAIELPEDTENQTASITNMEQNLSHHYQEIKTDESDSEIDFDNDADDQTLVKTPEHRSFEVFDFGPSLISEMESVFKSLKLRPGSKIQYEEQKDFGSKSSGKQKKQATMKPITSNDQKTIDAFISLTNEISTLSLKSGNKEQKSITPNSPTRRKFSFRLPSVLSGSKSNAEELRNFSDEIRAIPDLQSTVTEEEQLAYEELIEKSSPPISVRNIIHHRSKPLKTFKPEDVSLENPLKIIRSGTVPLVKPRFKSRDSVGKHSDLISFDYAPIIPPKSEKSRILLSQANKGRHVRKHPLIMPTSTNIQRTLNKVTERNNSNNQEDNLEFEASINQQLDILEKFGNDGSEESIERVLNANLMYRREDNVSYEDLLSFANIKPSSRERGVDSDEVRIMSKVFRRTEISNEQCLEILEFTDWNIHKSIKLVKLENMLNEVNLKFSLEKLSHVLDNVEWDLIKAFDYIKNNEEATVVHV